MPSSKVKGHRIDCLSNMHGVLERAFGSLPICLAEKDVGVLRGIAACDNEGIHAVIEAIYKHGSIDIWVAE
jgi:hypothetical protein